MLDRFRPLSWILNPAPKRLSLFRAGLAGLLIVALIFGTACSRPVTSSPTPTPASPAEEFPLLQEVWQLLQERYVEKEVLNKTELERGAIRGMLEALDDRYTAYLTPELYDMEIASLQGKFEGIGAYVSKEEGAVVVTAPIPDTPAERAGMRPGSRILEVNGESTEKMTIQEAVLKIRGPKGTQVRLKVLHPDAKEPVELVITRQEIKVTSVRQEVKEGLGYLQLFHFTERTPQELREALLALLRQGVPGIVLDLRNNPGGLLTAVVEVADEFLEAGVVLYEVDRDGNRKEWRSRSGGLATKLPLVVLMNSYSASGSEVLSGALQDRGRAIIIGVKSFGKGSVNSIHVLSDRSALYLTVARWLTPNGSLIEKQGLEPDIVVEVPSPAPQGAEDLPLKRAMEYLKEQLKAAPSRG